MKTLIIAVNAKFIHSNIAVRYLAQSLDSAIVAEYTINEDPEYVLSHIYAQRPDIAAFSCYIWNIDYIFKLARNLKKVLPDIRIVLGGPEVGFTPDEVLKENRFIDYVVCSEGEVIFPKLINAITTGSLVDIPGVFPSNDPNPDIFFSTIKLENLPIPYSGSYLAEFDKNRILYYESSRGCPFSCSYCLSQNYNNVRYLPMDRVKKDICWFIEAGIPRVKFVDRTFNANLKRAKEIIRYIIENNKETNFHFEAAGDLFDEELLSLLRKIPKGMIQLEIGIQSTNRKTLEAVNRKTDLDKVFSCVREIVSFENIHVHVDLIAGLPYEDIDSFRNSFNETYNLKAHKLQLGFLKLLKGSAIRNESAYHGYKYRDYPPYEILSCKYLNYDEIILLKGIEEVLERYYNSGRFLHTLNYAIRNIYKDPFEFFRLLYCFNDERGHIRISVSAVDQYNILYEFFEQNLETDDMLNINSLMKLDYFSSNISRKLPNTLYKKYGSQYKEITGQIYKKTGYSIKTSHIEEFDINIDDLVQNDYDPKTFDRMSTLILFDYRKKDIIYNKFPYIVLK